MPWAERRLHDSEPVNTLTNLAYAAAGTAIFVTHPGPEAGVIGLALLVLTAGSMWFHWRPSRKSLGLDHLGMAVAMATLAAYAIAHPYADGWWLAAVMVLTAVAVVYRPKHLHDARRMTGDLVGLTLLGLGPSRLSFAALGVFGLAYGLWQIDVREDWLGRWGHGLWHVLTAAAIFLAFLAGNP